MLHVEITTRRLKLELNHVLPAEHNLHTANNFLERYPNLEL